MAFTLTFTGRPGELPDAESRMTVDEVRKRITAVHQRILERLGKDLDELAILKQIETRHINARLAAKAATPAEKMPGGTGTGSAAGPAPAAGQSGAADE